MKESTAGHGPKRGFSSMNRALRRYLNQHPDHRAEQKRRRRGFGLKEKREKKLDEEK